MTDIQETLEKLIDAEAEKRAIAKFDAIKQEVEEIKQRVDNLNSLFWDKEEEKAECDDSVQENCEVANSDVNCEQEVNGAPSM